MKKIAKRVFCLLLICAMILGPMQTVRAEETVLPEETAWETEAPDTAAEAKESPAEEKETEPAAEALTEEAEKKESAELAETPAAEETREAEVPEEETAEIPAAEEVTETKAEEEKAEETEAPELTAEEETAEAKEETSAEAEKLPAETTADPMAVDDSGESFVYTADNLTLNCVKRSGKENELAVTITQASGDIVIPGVITGTSGTEYTVTAMAAQYTEQVSTSYGYNTRMVWGFTPAMRAGITSITFPDTIREIPGNLFDWNNEYNRSILDYGMPNHVNKHGGSSISFSAPESFNAPDSQTTVSKIPAFILNHYEDGAYYAGKCLLRVDPDYKGNFTVKDGTICILASAFEGCDGIRKVEIPDSVEYIGVRAFANSSVTEVNLPKGLNGRTQAKDGSTIECMTFFGCKYLKKVRFDCDGIYKIGYEGFLGCSSLEEFDMTKVQILETLAFAFAFAKGYELDLTKTDQYSWGWGLFMGSGISSVTFGDETFESIWFEYFRNCKNLKKVVLTPYQKQIGTNAFEYCESLTEDPFAFEGCAVERIAHHAFAYSGLKEVTIPKTLTNMDGGVFAGNPNLVTLNWKAPKPTSGAGNLFAFLDDSMLGMSTTGDMQTMGERALSMPAKAGTDFTAIKTLNVWNMTAENMAGFNPFFFAEEPYLETVNIHVAWTKIPTHAFFDCPSLKHVNLDEPEALKTVEFNAFGASGLEEVELLPGVEYVRQAYMCCMNLKHVTVADGVEEIGPLCFYQCRNLKTVEVKNPAKLKRIDQEAFGKCGLEEAVIMKDVVYDWGVFQYNENLKKVVVEDGVTVIPTLALEGAPKLEKVAIPASVKTIGQGAFKNSGKGIFYYLSDQVTVVEDEAFGYSGENGRTAEVLLVGDPGIELYHPGYGNSTKYTTALDNRVLQGVWMRGDHPGYANYSGAAPAAWLPEVKELPAQTVTITSEEKYIGVGEMPDKSKVTVTVDGQVLSQDEFDLEFDTADLTTGEREVKVILKKDTDAKVVLCNVISAGNFYDEEKEGPVYRISERTDLSFPIEVRAYLTRIYGNTRYKTGLATAEAVKKELGAYSFPAIIVATGENFADALAGSYLSAQKKAPIVLINEKNKARICSYIQENLAYNGTLYILGGEKALPWEWLYQTQYWNRYDYKRISGNTRYLTALEILKEAGVKKGEEVLICTGEEFADSLSAASSGKPLFLVKDKLNQKQKDMLASLKKQGCTFTILGGEKAVSKDLEALIRAEVGDALNADRIAGKTRYQTSAMVAEKYFPKARKMILVTGENYPDGLCGGYLGLLSKAPILLTKEGKESAAAAYAKDHGIHSAYVLGGAKLVTDTMAKTIVALPETAYMEEIFYNK